MSTLISGKPSSGEKKAQKEAKKLKRQIIIYHDDSTLHWHIVIHFIGKKNYSGEFLHLIFNHLL
jgi:hypothetical protein